MDKIKILTIIVGTPVIVWLFCNVVAGVSHWSQTNEITCYDYTTPVGQKPHGMYRPSHGPTRADVLFPGKMFGCVTGQWFSKPLFSATTTPTPAPSASFALPNGSSSSSSGSSLRATSDSITIELSTDDDGDEDDAP